MIWIKNDENDWIQDVTDKMMKNDWFKKIRNAK